MKCLAILGASVCKANWGDFTANQIYSSWLATCHPMQMEGGGGGIETIWELHTLAVTKLAATKECRKLNNPGGIMVVMETSFASSTAVFYSLLAVGHTHAETVQRAKFTGSFLQEHM